MASLSSIYFQVSFYQLSIYNFRFSFFNLQSSFFTFQFLTMARQPAIQWPFFFLVALNAKSHFKIDAADSVHAFNFTVTLTAVDIFPDMSLMFKQNMLGQKIGFSPGYRCPGIKILMLLLYLRMIGNNILMTVQAFLHRRDSWKRGPVYIRVTEPALNLFYPGVNPVTKGNRLFWT